MSALRAERVGAPRRTSWLTIVGLVLVPLVVGGLLTWALWEPTQRLERITAAVVNDDEPVQLDGQTVPLGRQLSAALVTGQAAVDPDAATGDENVAGSSNPTSFTWILTDSAHAKDGVADGTYDAVVTIPKDFSAAATSSADPDTARTATISIATSPQARPVDGAIAQAIAQAAAGVTGTQLTQSYLERVLVGFSTLGDKLGDAADGADQLADGVGKLGNGASGLADGADQLSSGLGQLASGTSGLAGGLGQLSSGASGLAGGVGQLSTGASGLADGVGQIADGTAGLAGGVAQLSDGAAGLADGAGQLGDGASGIADGADQLSRGAGQLADGLDQLAAQTDAAADEAQAGVAGAQQFAQGLDQLADGVAQVGQGAATTAGAAVQLDQLLTGLLGAEGTGLAAQCSDGDATACSTLGAAVAAQQDALRQLSEGVRQGTAGLDQGLNGASAQDPDSLVNGSARAAAGGQQLADGAQQSATGLATLASYLGASADGAADLADGAGALATGADGFAGGAADLASGAEQLAGGAADAADGAAQLAGGAAGAADGADKLADGASQAASGADRLASGAQASAAGAGQIADGTARSADGAGKLADGADQLADGADQAADGTSELADGLGQAVDGIPTYSDEQATSLAKVVADPVTLKSGETDLLGSSSVPFLLALALWLGGLATFLVLSPVGREALGTPLGSTRIVLRAYAPAAFVGVVQGLALSAVMAFALDLTPGGWARFTTLCVLAGVAFAAVNQGLVALLGGIGRFLAVVVAVVALATGVISTVPPLLDTIAGLLPTAPVVDGLRAVVLGTGGYGAAVAALVVWALFGLAATVIAVARRRVVDVGTLSRWAKAA